MLKENYQADVTVTRNDENTENSFDEITPSKTACCDSNGKSCPLSITEYDETYGVSSEGT